MTWGDDTTPADQMLRDMSEVMAVGRRASMHVLGTPEQEAARAIGEALSRGAPMRVNRYLKPNTMLLVDGVVYFSSQELMDRFAASITPEPEPEHVAKVLPFRRPDATAAAPSDDSPL